MPIPVMALLALIVFGLIGILLAVAVIMEHSTPEPRPRRTALHPLPPDVASALNLSSGKPRGETVPAENPSAREKVDERACVG